MRAVRVGVYRCEECGTLAEIFGDEEEYGWVPRSEPPACEECGAEMELHDLEYRTEADYR